MSKASRLSGSTLHRQHNIPRADKIKKEINEIVTENGIVYLYWLIATLPSSYIICTVLLFIPTNKNVFILFFHSLPLRLVKT